MAHAPCWPIYPSKLEQRAHIFDRTTMHTTATHARQHCTLSLWTKHVTNVANAGGGTKSRTMLLPFCLLGVALGAQGAEVGQLTHATTFRHRDDVIGLPEVPRLAQQTIQKMRPRRVFHTHTHTHTHSTAQHSTAQHSTQHLGIGQNTAVLSASRQLDKA